MLVSPGKKFENFAQNYYEKLVFVGSYTLGTTPELAGSHGVGVYAVRIDSLGKLEVVAGPAQVGDNPSYLAFHPYLKVVYGLNEVIRESTVFALRFQEKAFRSLNTVEAGGSMPSALACDGHFLAVSFYGEGDGLALFELEKDGTIGQRRNTSIKLQRMHDVAFRDGSLFAVDIAGNQVYEFKIPTLDLVTQIYVPGGPRTLALPFVSLQKAAGVAELNLKTNTVKRTLLFPSVCGDVSTLALSPSQGLFVACRRFEDGKQGAIIRIQDATVSLIPTAGKKPRSFSLYHDRFLIVANQNSDSLLTIDLGLSIPSDALSAIEDLLSAWPLNTTSLSVDNLLSTEETPSLSSPSVVSKLEVPSPAFVGSFPSYRGFSFSPVVDAADNFVGDGSATTIIEAKSE